jgi:hypothetical protein
VVHSLIIPTKTADPYAGRVKSKDVAFQGPRVGDAYLHRSPLPYYGRKTARYREENERDKTRLKRRDKTAKATSIKWLRVRERTRRRSGVYKWVGSGSQRMDQICSGKKQVLDRDERTPEISMPRDEPETSIDARRGACLVSQSEHGERDMFCR